MYQEVLPDKVSTCWPDPCQAPLVALVDAAPRFPSAHPRRITPPESEGRPHITPVLPLPLSLLSLVFLLH